MASSGTDTVLAAGALRLEIGFLESKRQRHATLGVGRAGTYLDGGVCLALARDVDCNGVGSSRYLAENKVAGLVAQHPGQNGPPTAASTPQPALPE